MQSYSAEIVAAQICSCTNLLNRMNSNKILLPINLWLSNLTIIKQQPPTLLQQTLYILNQRWLPKLRVAWPRSKEFLLTRRHNIEGLKRIMTAHQKKWEVCLSIRYFPSLSFFSLQRWQTIKLRSNPITLFEVLRMRHLLGAQKTNSLRWGHHLQIPLLKLNKGRRWPLHNTRLKSLLWINSSIFLQALVWFSLRNAPQCCTIKYRIWTKGEQMLLFLILLRVPRTTMLVRVWAIISLPMAQPLTTSNQWQ